MGCRYAGPSGLIPVYQGNAGLLGLGPGEVVEPPARRDSAFELLERVGIRRAALAPGCSQLLTVAALAGSVATGALKRAVDGGAADAEQLGEVGRFLLPGALQPDPQRLAGRGEHRRVSAGGWRRRTGVIRRT